MSSMAELAEDIRCRCSILHPSRCTAAKPRSGKTVSRHDSSNLRPQTRIVQAITFDSPDPTVAGEMSMTVTFEERDSGTEVTILFEQIPPGIRPEDNDAGTRSSLEKLARYVE